MIKQFKKAILAAALTATALTAATPAMAQGYPGDYGHRRGGGDTAGAAILGGIIGIALGAAIASSGKNKHRGYNGGYRDDDGYYRDSGYDRGGYHRGHRHGRDEDCDERDRDGWRGGYNDRGGYYERRGYRDGYGYGNYQGY